jgi:heme-degrading monooxygenase HmoA
MFVSINRIPVKADSTQIMEERFGQSKGLEKVPGFIRFELLKRVWAPHSKDDSSVEYLAMTHWESQDAFMAWTKSDAFKQAHSGPKLDIFAGHAEPAGYDIAVERTL